MDAAERQEPIQRALAVGAASRNWPARDCGSMASVDDAEVASPSAGHHVQADALIEGREASPWLTARASR